MIGYKRNNGQPGIRNYVAVVYTVECAHHVAKYIAEHFEHTSVQYFGFAGCYPSDYGYRLLRGMCIHPNTGAVLIVGLGCENFDSNRLEQEVKASGRLCRRLIIQENNGTTATINKGVTAIKAMLTELEHTERVPITWEDLTIGTICGGSDGTSVITGNPAVGRAFDFLVEHKATCIFEESGELIGCEQHMMRRAATPAVAVAIDEEMAKCRAYYATLGLGSFSNGNAVGGLTTQEEKSLGAYAKSGNSRIEGVILPTEHAPTSGLYLMDVIPDGEVRFGYPNICDSAEACELIACGCQAILFTTGRGSDIGSVISPIIKVCNNPETYANMQEDMDVNAGKIISEGATLDDIRDDILKCLSNLASGIHCKSEKLGHCEYILTYKAYNFKKIPACKIH